MKTALVFLAIPLLAQSPAERGLGRQLVANVQNRGRPYDAPEQMDRLRRVGNRLAAQLPGTDWNFEALTIDATEPMAFPGGYIVVPARFFQSAPDESEFAAMLAHAMGHVVLRHGLRTSGPTPHFSVVFLGGGMSLHADSATEGFAIPLGYVARQRENELAADGFSLELTLKAGYDPGALRRYLERTLPADTDPRSSPLPPREIRLARLPPL